MLKNLPDFFGAKTSPLFFLAFQFQASCGFISVNFINSWQPGFACESCWKVANSLRIPLDQDVLARLYSQIQRRTWLSENRKSHLFNMNMKISFFVSKVLDFLDSNVAFSKKGETKNPSFKMVLVFC